MAKLYFRYGAMGASKTANAIMVAYNYKERGLHPLMLKPRIENRDGEMTIKSRIGLEWPCEFVEDWFPADEVTLRERLKEIDCIIIDEVQFVDPEVIKALQWVVVSLQIPVLCYGLREDFRGDPFAGAAELCARADKIEEIKTVCWCGQGATCNARIIDGKVVYEGPQIMLGANESYTALCRKHWLEGNLGHDS